MQDHDPEETCPYDETHRIRRSRMVYHLTKCSKQYKLNVWDANKKKKQCPYNACHIIDAPLFKVEYKINFGQFLILKN